jgi:hypothetical protein
MFKSILNFMNENDPFANWLKVSENGHDLRIIAQTLYSWIDTEYIEETQEVNEYLYYISEQLK